MHSVIVEKNNYYKGLYKSSTGDNNYHNSNNDQNEWQMMVETTPRSTVGQLTHTLHGSITVMGTVLGCLNGAVFSEV